jgi:hypothetical protein
LPILKIASNFKSGKRPDEIGETRRAVPVTTAALAKQGALAPGDSLEMTTRACPVLALLFGTAGGPGNA